MSQYSPNVTKAKSHCSVCGQGPGYFDDVLVPVHMSELVLDYDDMVVPRSEFMYCAWLPLIRTISVERPTV